MSDARPLELLWCALDDIDAFPDACVSSTDEVRALSLDELTSLIRFQDSLAGTTRKLKMILDDAERTAPPASFEEYAARGIIASLDHPVIVTILAKHQKFRSWAVRIKRAAIRSVLG